MDPINRIHFASKERRVSKSGEDTTILFGFMKQLFAMLTTRPLPFYCVIVFDAIGSDFRKSIYPGYKGQREETPQEVVNCVPLIQKALDALKIKWVRAHAVEADDVIGTLAHRFASDEIEVYIFSRDKVILLSIGCLERFTGFLSTNKRQCFSHSRADEGREVYEIRSSCLYRRVWNPPSFLD